MANFNLETNRNTSITKIPRLTFQLPQSTSGSTPSTTSPILFCQVGCNLEFNFTNITSATLKNDRTYFTIIPPDNSNNYINWNGTGKSGQNMIRFDLKEIKFSAPAKDIVGSITYNKSIQFYFTFVNTDYPNIMIVISVIGQANNVGSAQSDGFILLNELAPQIPTANETKTLSNLKNINLGNLLPSNKSFFTTLIDAYISMTKIIDIPDSFLNNIISRVVGSQQAYDSKVNQNTQQIPTNPVGTIIYYTENIKSIGSDEAYVCNSNCDRVVGNASLLQPTFGTSSTIRSQTGPTNPLINGGKITGKLPQEECEEEYVFPGTRTNVRIKSAIPSTSIDTSKEKNLNYSYFLNQIIAPILFSFIIIFCSYIIIVLLERATNLTGIMSFFTREFWQVRNIGLIIFGLIGIFSIVIFSSIGTDMFRKKYNNNDNLEKTEKQRPWVFFVIGFSIWTICILILVVSFKYNGTSNSVSNFFNFNRYTTSYDIPINPAYPQFKGFSEFNRQSSKILSDYQRSPASFFKLGSQGRQDILDLSNKYKDLSPLTKATLAKYQQSISPFLNPSSEFIKNIKSSQPTAQPTLKSFFDNLIYSSQISQLQSKVTDKLLNNFKELQLLKPQNKDLANLIPQLKVGADIPLAAYEYMKK